MLRCRIHITSVWFNRTHSHLISQVNIYNVIMQLANLLMLKYLKVLTLETIIHSFGIFLRGSGCLTQMSAQSSASRRNVVVFRESCPPQPSTWRRRSLLNPSAVPTRHLHSPCKRGHFQGARRQICTSSSCSLLFSAPRSDSQKRTGRPRCCSWLRSSACCRCSSLCCPAAVCQVRRWKN